MDYILELISSIVGSHGNQRFLFVVLVAGAVFALGISMAFIAAAFGSPLRRRLARISDSVQWQEKQSESDLKRSSDLNKSLEVLAKIVTPDNEKDRTAIQQRLVRAGFRTDSSVGTFYAAKTILLIVFGLIGALVTRWYPELTPGQILLYVGAGAFVGMILPN